MNTHHTVSCLLSPPTFSPRTFRPYPDHSDSLFPCPHFSTLPRLDTPWQWPMFQHTFAHSPGSAHPKISFLIGACTCHVCCMLLAWSNQFSLMYESWPEWSRVCDFLKTFCYGNFQTYTQTYTQREEDNEPLMYPSPSFNNYQHSAILISSIPHFSYCSILKHIPGTIPFHNRWPVNISICFSNR